MQTLKSFKCGSSYFFSSYSDYKIKDCDEIQLCDTLIKDIKVLNLKQDKMDIFFVKQLNKPSEYIESCFEKNVPPMRAGKFLIPEFSNYINFTIEDLKKLKPCFDNMDEKHSYEKIIFDSYVENDGFYLTDEQRNKAYDDYKQKRKNIYNN